MEILSYILHESEGFCRSVMSDSLQPHGLYQAPLSMRFPRQEYWSELPFPTAGDLPGSGIEPVPPALGDGFFTTEPPGSPKCIF